MVIQEQLLLSYGADMIELAKDQILFNNKTESKFYYQIKTGCIKLVNCYDLQREFIHSLSIEGDCVGETFIFSPHPYIISAIAIEDCTVLKLHDDGLKQLLMDYPNYHYNLYQYTAEVLHYSRLMAYAISLNDSKAIISSLLNYLKNSRKYQKEPHFKVPFTRQQVASLTGLRVETVIRTVKRMEQDGTLQIIQGKIFYRR